MLTQRHLPSKLPTFLVAVLLWSMAVAGQGDVGFLRTDGIGASAERKRVDRLASPVQAFTFARNLIFFEALVDGRPGKFILDTGAPSLIVNDRGQGDHRGNYTGLGAGGEVQLSDHRVDRFEMGGRKVENYWAIGLDLRDFEARTAQQIDGFVGYDLLNWGELRIDYQHETFQLLRSTRRPTHSELSPRAVLKFFLLDHLPVVQLQLNGRAYYFALDTGAGANLLDADLLPEVGAVTTQRGMNIQGLDGTPANCPVVAVAVPPGLPVTTRSAVEFVAMDVAHLQREGGVQLAGILGSAFLSQYTVGIDYRRRKVYLW